MCETEIPVLEYEKIVSALAADDAEGVPHALPAFEAGKVASGVTLSMVLIKKV